MPQKNVRRRMRAASSLCQWAEVRDLAVFYARPLLLQIGRPFRHVKATFRPFEFSLRVVQSKARFNSEARSVYNVT
jgi:hypothetical protein